LKIATYVVKQDDDGNYGEHHRERSDSSYDDYSTTSIDDEAVPVAAAAAVLPARRPRCTRCNNVSLCQSCVTDWHSCVTLRSGVRQLLQQLHVSNNRFKYPAVFQLHI
jgi:hypothetical protein